MQIWADKFVLFITWMSETTATPLYHNHSYVLIASVLRLRKRYVRWGKLFCRTKRNEGRGDMRAALVLKVCPL